MTIRPALAAAMMVLVAAVGLATADRATAATKIATLATSGCTSGPVWRIGYRLYYQDTAGRTTTRDATTAALGELALFVDAVGQDSACGIRVVVDAFDMQGASWPASTNSTEKPADTTDFLSSGAYDSTFNRFPTNGEGYCANTDIGLSGSFARFPVDADGGLGCVMGGPDCRCEPWKVLLLHEWLHQTVAFYEPRLGWPIPDVHGACEHGYSTNCATYEPYFVDMMQGRVPEAGGMRGIQPDEWALEGTPAQPVRAVAVTRVASDSAGTVAVDVPADLGGPVTVTARNFDNINGAPETTFDPPQYRFQLPDGLWFVCLRFAGSRRYRAFNGRCDQPIQVQRGGAPAPPFASPQVSVPGAPLEPPLVQKTPDEPMLPGQSAKPTQPRFLSLRRTGRSIRVVARRTGTQPLVLLARRGSMTRVVRGTARGTLVRFSIALPRGSWRLRLRSGNAGPSAIYSAVRTVRIR